MGYYNYGKGSYLPVRVSNGNVEIQFNTGVELYSTSLKIDSDWNIIQFYVDDVLFMIQHDDVRYIGRPDGTISGYRINDNLLVASAVWTVPPKPVLKPIGAMYTLIPCAAELDLVRKRIVYTPYTKDEFVFDKPFTDDIFMPTSLGDSLNSTMRKLHITRKNGEEVNCDEEGQWFVQKPFTGVCDTSIF